MTARAAVLSGIRSRLNVAVVLGIAALAVLSRLTYFGQWPTGYGKTLEFDAANAARSIWINLTGAHETWQQAWLQAHVGRFIEPPVLQTLTALTYLPDGVERPWTAQVFALTFWFAASAFLFSAVRRLTDWWGATLALAYILLAPFAIIISKNFQVEPLLVLCFAIVLWYSGRGDVLAGNRIVWAAIIGALAGLSKPGVLLPFVSVLYFVSALEGGSLRDRRRLLRLAGLIAVVALPAFLYVGFVIPGQVGGKILPQLWWDPDYYIGWAKNIYRIIGVVPLAGAIAGFVLVPRLRILGLSLLVADAAYGAAFTWHTMTHEYYQVPPMVAVAIGLGGLGQWLAANVRLAPLRRGLPIALALAVAIPLTYVIAPHGYLGDTPGRYPAQTRLEVVGQRVGAGNWVIAYTEGYGKAMMYYGRVLVDSWPTSTDEDYLAKIGDKPETIEQRLSGFIADHNAHYFAVTEFTPDSAPLVAFLDAGYPLVESGPDLRIYDLTSPLEPGLPRSTPTSSP
jgi:hypothetical protein